MKKSICFAIVVISGLFMVLNSHAQEEGRAFFDFGVFAYEDGDYQDAEVNLKKALEFEPDNADYYHYLGKTYLKLDRFDEAMAHFSTARGIDPDLPGLAFDIAYLYYKKPDFKKAAELFMDIAREEPANVMAFYHAGISLLQQKRYEKALDYFLDASEKSPTVKVNGTYYAGICYQQLDNIPKSVEMFEYVKSNATSESLRENAARWLRAISEDKKTRKPFSIYLKLGGQYDDNVRLEPLDRDIYADEGDAAVIGHAMGTYNIVNRKDLTLGAGYSHYQALYMDLDEFDLTGSTGTLYIKYRLSPVTLGLNYLPSYYWVDSDSYLRQHLVRPEMICKFGDRLLGRLSYSYTDKDYFDEPERDGYRHDGFLDLYYSLLKNKLRVFGGAGYGTNDASHQDYDYGEIKTRMGCSWKAPWEMAVTMTGKYEARRYDHDDSLYEKTREDDKYVAAASVSHPVYFDWLSLMAEYQYTKNFSNIDDYEYDRNVVTVSMTVRY